jgi:hypothetical protein
MGIQFVPIDNPRTPDGSWEDDEYGCHKCGCITSAYIGIEFRILGEPMIIIKLCKGCFGEGEKIINKLILDQCHKGRI